MKKLFNNILVPVDFTNASSLAVEKAITIANDFRCHLHFLHVITAGVVPVPADGHFFAPVQGDEKSNGATRLKHLGDKCQSLLGEGLTVHTVIKKGNAEHAIVEYALQQNIDLVIVGKSQKKLLGNLFSTLSINRLARKLPCPVLTCQGKPSQDKVENIVMPVGANLPVRKIMFAAYLAQPFNSKIHLISLTKRYPITPAAENAYLFRTYQMLRDNTDLPVECHTVPGENIAETTLAYAQKIDADLIVVNPGKELLLSGLINRLFARFLSNESRIPVMTVAPAH